MQTITVALLGNANAGKTTLFNTLTSSTEHVGNWHGVTVDAKSKTVEAGGVKYKCVDLPGAYSLTPFSREEAITRDYVLAYKEAVYVNVIDSNNLSKSLYLTLQLIEAGVKVVVVLNMFKEFEKSGKVLDIAKLERLLGVMVVKVSSREKKDIPALLTAVLSTHNSACKADVSKFRKDGDALEYAKNASILAHGFSYINKFRKKELSEIVARRKTGIDDFYIMKLAECDEQVHEMLHLSSSESEIANKASAVLGGMDAVGGVRFKFIDQVLSECVKKTAQAKPYGYSRLDKVFLNKYLSLPLFLLTMLTIFFVTFGCVGSALSSGFEFLVVTLFGGWLTDFVIMIGAPLWVIALVRDAIVSGVGMVISFLPQVVLLFICLSILEEIGYLSRLAYVLEGVFARIGLSGRSVFTLLMGFGCSATAITTVRNLDNENIRKKTAILTPYMSCNAKLPVYVVLGGAFFGVGNVFLIFGLYILGVAVAVLLALVLEHTILKSGRSSFVMEMPPYRVPSLKQVGKVAFVNAELFTVRVGTLILCLSVVVWFLENFTFGFSYVTDHILQTSMLKQIGIYLAPIFEPLGWGSWGAVSAMLCGIVAKEVIISTIGILNGINASEGLSVLKQTLSDPASVVYFTPEAAVSYLVFALLFIPCIAAISSLRREVGVPLTMLACAIQFALAYIVSFVALNLAGLVFRGGAVSAIIGGLAVVGIITAVMLVFNTVHGKRKCTTCANCHKKCF